MNLRLIHLLAIVLLGSSSHGQTIDLGEDRSITGQVVPFDTSAHVITRCKVLDWKENPICLIDGKPIFGTDLNYLAPRSQLTELVLHLAGHQVSLDVSCMYNPSYEAAIADGQFDLEPAEGGFKLTGRFSDGAGSYQADWFIINGSAVRTRIERFAP